MRGPIEEGLSQSHDSDEGRSPGKSGRGSGISQSRAYPSLRDARRHLFTMYQSIRHPAMFNEVRILCLFIGHVKSGGTMIGALLDAHPEAIVADEVDVVRLVAAGFRRNQIFHLLVRGSKREARNGRVTARRLNPYSFAVPGLSQGTFTRLRVIGDSRAGPTTRRLGEQPELIGRLQDVMTGIEPRFVHVVRNPYDPISAMIVRGSRTFENAIDDYFMQCTRLIELRKRIPAADVLEVRYEAFVQEPAVHLDKVCRFLGIAADPTYLAAATGIIEDTRPLERGLVKWTPEWISRVASRIGDVGFLEGYDYET